LSADRRAPGSGVRGGARGSASGARRPSQDAGARDARRRPGAERMGGDCGIIQRGVRVAPPAESALRPAPSHDTTRQGDVISFGFA